jgi:signal transduction histidine kinase
MEMDAPIGTDDFRTLNRCLDDAIAGAVTEYSRVRDVTRDGESAHESEHLGFLAHELRNLTNTAMLAFEVLQTGNVGIGGSTGAVVQRSLMGIRALINRSLAEVRLSQGVQNLEQFLVSPFIEELAPAAGVEASARNVTLSVMPVEDGVMIAADRQVLASVVGNLLQNAFKFTRPGTTVTLRVGASAERVLIEIQDECGGLQGENITELFRPFEQRSADRSGLGLGLAFSRWAIEANHGRIYARNADKGCVFTIDLPRVSVPVAMASSQDAIIEA